MKKLMIAAMVVSIAAISQAAASFNWSSSDNADGTLYNGASGNANKAGNGTLIYLFDAATLSQKAAYDAFIGGTLSAKLEDAVKDSALNSSSRISLKSGIEYGSADSTYDMYWIALIGSDKLYISSIKEGVSPVDVGGKTLQWTDLRTTSNNGVKTAWDTSASSHAGVYGAVPEPTSAMLLLLGMAGLALRRRRA